MGEGSAHILYTVSHIRSMLSVYYNIYKHTQRLCAHFAECMYITDWHSSLDSTASAVLMYSVYKGGFHTISVSGCRSGVCPAGC